MFETPYMKIWKKDDVLFCAYTDKLEIDLGIAKHCVESRIKFSEGVSYPVLIRLKGVHSINKEARDYLGEQGADLITAGALIISSPLTRLLGNIFLSINRPKAPTKLFTDEAEALKWLKQYSAC